MRLLGYLGRAVARTMLPRQVISRLPASRDARVCLTFDDGPHREHTPQILDILARNDLLATFFFTGHQAERMPELIRAARQQGHDVANHGYRHLRLSEISHDEFMVNVERGHDVLEQIVGSALPRLFRPPYGGVGLRELVALRRAGHRLVLWTVDSTDSWLNDPDQVVAAVLGGPLRSRSIVLLHEDYAWTVEALPRLVRDIRELGFCLVPLLGRERPSALEADAPTADGGDRRCA